MAKQKVHPDFTEVKFKARVLELKGGETVPFAFGIDGKGGDHSMLFHNKRSGKPLLKILTDNQPQVGAGVFGDATLDGQTVVLDCNKKIPGLKKAAKAWVKALKHPLLKKTQVLVGGQSFKEEGEEDEEEATAAPPQQQAAPPPPPQAEESAPPAEPDANQDAPPPATDVDGKLQKQLGAALSKMAPLLKKAITADPASKDGLLKRTADLKAAIGEGSSLDEAKTGLMQLGEDLKSLLAGGGQGSEATLEEEVPATQAEDAPPPPPPAAELPPRELKPRTRKNVSLVKLGRARIELEPLQRNAIGEINLLKFDLQREFREDEEQAAQLAAALVTLDGVIQSLSATIPNQLDEILNADEDAREPLIDNVRRSIFDLERLVDTDPVISKLDGNEVRPDMAVVGPLRQKLAEVSAALG